MRIALDERTVEHSERRCSSVVDWDDGLLLADLADAELYPDFAAAVRAEPSEKLRPFVLASASHDG